MLKWLSIITLLALAAGVVVGATAAGTGDQGLIGLATEVEYIGALWLNLLRMTVIPLVFSLLVTGVASVADAASTGRLAARSIWVFAVLLIAATTSPASLSRSSCPSGRLIRKPPPTSLPAPAGNPSSPHPRRRSASGWPVSRRATPSRPLPRARFCHWWCSRCSSALPQPSSLQRSASRWSPSSAP